MSIQHLTFVVTNKCNLSCKFCYKDNLNTEEKPLQIDELNTLFCSLINLKTIQITGGEPSLSPNLAAILSILSFNTTLEEVSLSTNGTMLSQLHKSVLGFLRNNENAFLRIKISIHGFEDYHDRVCRIKGSFKKAIETVRSLVSLSMEYSNLIVYTSTVVTNENINQVLSFSKWVRLNLNPDFVETLPARNNNNNICFDDNFVDEYKKISTVVLDNYFKHEHSSKNNNQLESISENVNCDVEYVADNLKMPISCKAGCNHIVLNPDGEVYPCEFIKCKTDYLAHFGLNADDMYIGNIRLHNYNIEYMTKLVQCNKSLSDVISNCYCGVPCILRMNRSSK